MPAYTTVLCSLVETSLTVIGVEGVKASRLRVVRARLKVITQIVYTRVSRKHKNDRCTGIR